MTSMTSSTEASGIITSTTGLENTPVGGTIFDAVTPSQFPADYLDDAGSGSGFDGYGDYEQTTGFDDYEYDVFIYPGYSFERPVYMYIWGILVIITFLVNIIVISVLLRKKMRNPTNMILTAIAISDSLTGLVTLPSYWLVYSKFHPASAYSYPDYNYSDTTQSHLPTRTVTETVHLNVTMPIQDNDSAIPVNTESYHESYHYEPQYEVQDGYFLTQHLCRAFMISKYFLSKTFHTVSIWLTLFLGFQRFISVASPFRAQKLLSQQTVIIICVIIAGAAPLLHIYHLLDEKADKTIGMCQWDLEENCGGGCAYLVISFVLRHFVPCVLLVIFTILFIMQLAKSSSRISRIDSNRGNTAMQHRDSENKRVSLIVTLIVIVFLIPEVPYGGFILYALIGKLTNVTFNLETNRAIHLVYELSLVLSFHANFYIYTFFNRRFRKGLLKGFVYPLLTCCGKGFLFGPLGARDSASSSFTTNTRRRTMQSETGTRIEMRNVRRSSSSAGKSTTVTDASKFINGKPHEEQGEKNETGKFLPQ